MANLKELRGRISSVKSTRKIVTAMKMVASSKLRRAQAKALQAVPYADGLAAMLSALRGEADEMAPPLFRGFDNPSPKHLIILIGSDRGLCGGFHSALFKFLREFTADLKAKGQEPHLLIVGNKLISRMGSIMPVAHTVPNISKTLSFSAAEAIGQWAMDRFLQEDYGQCSVIYSRFVSALTQVPTLQGLMPLPADTAQGEEGESSHAKPQSTPEAHRPYLYEPSKDEIFAQILPKNVHVQIYRALLQSAASEEAARMNAMDNASRNAKEVIDDLTLLYNQTRQAQITNELMEIIAGSEAL
jgi:F-type H+-transporting ATPase subunit gamma